MNRSKQITVTQAIIFFNILLFILQSTRGLTRDFLISPFENFNFISYFLSAFTHIDILHLLFNMIFLFYIGSILERFLGMVNYIIFYILAIILSGLVVDLFSKVYVAGASGVLYAMLAALIVFKYRYPYKLYYIPKNYLERILLINIIFTLVVPNISRVGHLGGAIAGAVIAGIFIAFEKNSYK